MADSSDNKGLSNSFTDLMTSLAVIFILLLCASLNNAQMEGEESRNSVLTELQKQLKEYAKTGVQVKSDPKDPLGLLILVPEGLLEFQLDKADIPEKGEVFLSSFIPKLANVVCAEKFVKEINSIVVEGHTDSSGTDQHNWELSQKRSMSVVRTSLSILGNGNTGKEKEYFVQFLSASGRGSAEIVKDASGIENRPLSRRVVFKIRVRSFEQKPLLEMLGKGKG
jgi:outer membrane protein OmpA-like peptidoglycan-associated protein